MPPTFADAVRATHFKVAGTVPVPSAGRRGSQKRGLWRVTALGECLLLCPCGRCGPPFGRPQPPCSRASLRQRSMGWLPNDWGGCVEVSSTSTAALRRSTAGLSTSSDALCTGAGRRGGTVGAATCGGSVRAGDGTLAFGQRRFWGPHGDGRVVGARDVRGGGWLPADSASCSGRRLGRKPGRWRAVSPDVQRRFWTGQNRDGW